MKIGKPDFPTIFILLLLLSAAFKDDSDAIANSEFWSELAVPAWLSIFKNNSDSLMVISGAIGFALSLRTTPVIFSISRTALALLTLATLAVFRAIQDYPDAAPKLFLALLISSFIFFVSGRLIARQGAAPFKTATTKAFVYFATILILTNGFIHILGYGFVPQNPRFFGTAIHPNFIGVQLSICNIIIASRFLATPRKAGKLFFFTAVLCLGLWLMLSSGSRTSLVIFLTGAAVLTTAGNKYRIKWWMIVMMGIILLAGIYIASAPTLQMAFYRGEGGGNTRTEAWATMIEQILEHPWIGHGHYTGQSENSYLRAMSAFGIPYGIGMIAILIACATRLLMQSLLNKSDQASSQHLFLALILAISVGGIFEGYIADSWSLPKLVFILLLALLPKSPLSSSTKTKHAKA